MKSIHLIFFICSGIIGGLLFLLQSCNKVAPICYEPTVVVAPIEYDEIIYKRVDTVIDGRHIDSINIYQKDTILRYLNALYISPTSDTMLQILAIPNTSTISLYLNPNESYSIYAIRYDTVGAYMDTLKIYHQAYPHFISNACGYTSFFQIDSIQYISEHIDSVRLFKNEVTLDNANNSRMAYFYFKRSL